MAPPAPLAMEVATSILYLDASIEGGDLDHPELAGRVQRLARRIDDLRIGAEPQPLETWMEENEWPSLTEMRGNMNVDKIPNPQAYARANYMMMVQGWERA